MKDACHFHFPILRKISVPPSPPLPLKEFFRIRSLCSALHDPQFLAPGCALYSFQNDIHTDCSVNGTQELCSIQPNPMALDVPKSRQATPRISSRPLIGWWGVQLFYRFQIIQQFKCWKMKHPRESEYSHFQLHGTCILHPQKCQFYYSEFHWNWPKSLGHFLPSSTCYYEIIGLKMIIGSLIMGPIDSVFQLREKFKISP